MPFTQIGWTFVQNGIKENPQNRVRVNSQLGSLNHDEFLLKLKKK